METELTTYLLRTIQMKPTGLKMRLRIATVTRSLISFEENSLPAASIMWHGLFLERPTQTGVRDPMLLAVINQDQLSDDEVQVGLGVFSEAVLDSQAQSENESQSTHLRDFHLEHRLHAESIERSECIQPTQQRLSISRFGIVKHLPKRVPIDLPQKTDSTKYITCTKPRQFYHCMIASDWSGRAKIDPHRVQLPGELNPFVIRPLDTLISILDELIKIPNQAAIKTSLSQPMPAEPQNESDTAVNVRPPPLLFYSCLNKFAETCDWMLCALQTNILFLDGFALASRPEDSRVFDSAWQRTHQQLERLANAIRDLFLRPIAETIEGMTDRPSISMNPQLDQIRDYVIKSLQITEEHIQFSRNPQPQYRRFGAEKWIEPQMELRTPYLDRMPMRFFVDAKTMMNICSSKIEVSMSKNGFSRDVRNQINVAQSRNLVQWVTHASNTDEFSQISGISHAFHIDHKACQRLSASGRVQRMNTGPALYGENYTRLDAAFTSHRTTFFAVSRDPNIPIIFNQPEPERITHLKLFRGESEITSYQIFALDLNHGYVGFNYFTGRYLLSIKIHQGLAAWSNLYLLDLAPCTKQQPEPPIVVKHRIVDLLGQKVTYDDLLACTDEFLSCYLVESKTDPQQSTPMLTSVLLCIVKFDTIHLGQSPVKICLTDEYLKVTDMIGTPAPYHRNAYERICWSKDQRTLFHATWDLDQPAAQNTLLVVCYTVSKKLETAKLMTYSYTHQKEFLPQDLFGKCKPRFHTLRTEQREYFVVDITSVPIKDARPFLARKRSVRVLGRLLFTLHKNKLHRVSVNGQHLYRFPAYIGNRIGYAGYESGHLSLFHQRREFSTDKVVSAVYRLDYKSL